jgi:hypothetical protein
MSSPRPWGCLHRQWNPHSTPFHKTYGLLPLPTREIETTVTSKHPSERIFRYRAGFAGYECILC